MGEGVEDRSRESQRERLPGGGAVGSAPQPRGADPGGTSMPEDRRVKLIKGRERSGETEEPRSDLTHLTLSAYRWGD